jgi:hypothetical protein
MAKIKYDNELIHLDVETRAELGRDYMLRLNLVAQLKDIETKDLDTVGFNIYLYYPSCVACSTGTFTLPGKEARDIRSMTVQEWLDNLPGVVIRHWADSVFQLNPDFLEFEPADEKKS